MSLPSGDHVGGPIGPKLLDARCFKFLPSTPIVDSLRSEVVKAIDLLSGDQTNEVFKVSRSVIFLAGPVPSAAITWISSRPLWSEMKAMDLPSGEYWTSRSREAPSVSWRRSPSSLGAVNSSPWTLNTIRLPSGQRS